MSDEIFADVRARIDAFRVDIDKQIAGGKMPTALPYRDDGREVFVLRVTRLGGFTFHLKSPHGLIDRLSRAPSTDIFNHLDFGPSDAGPGVEIAYAFATKHGEALQLQVGFMRSICAPTPEDFARDLRLLIALPASMTKMELN